MSSSFTSYFASGSAPTFSGHETFVLRSNWLKKAYDVLSETPDLFYHQDAFALLGVGKNMAQSIRFWGRGGGVFERAAQNNGHVITQLGHALLANDGWDPFLVSPASHWLLHWQIAARPEAAFTWFYTFNLLKGGEFTAAQLAHQIQSAVADHGYRVPSDQTINRDIACMLNCYCRPSARQLATAAEDLLLCPLLDLDIVQALPGQHIYRLASGPQTELPDALVAYAIAQMLRGTQRKTIAFSDLAYAPFSPGRVFRLEADALLSRLNYLREITDGRAYYSEQAGIRQVAWDSVDDLAFDIELLARAFADEVQYV
jgi:hypothetical protein